jgi:hypothetical protein
LELEWLEERATPSVSVIENFEGGDLSAYRTVLRYAPSAQVVPYAGHDGDLGLVKQDGYEWVIRNDPGAQFSVGQTLSTWVRFDGVADGRAYFGFDARPNGTLHSPLSAGGTLSLVLAANTNELLLENNHGFNQDGTGTTATFASVPQTYQADTWYRVEVSWAPGGNFTGNLYDSDGVTLLNSVSGTTSPQFTSGGFAFRALGHNKSFDTVVVDDDSSGTVEERANAGGGLDPNWDPGTAPGVPVNGPSTGPAFVPWGYTSIPDSGRDVELAQFNQLQQVAIVGGTVGLAAGNLSAVHATQQIGWGPPVYGAFNSGVPLETPLLAQYLFRQRPGEPTQLIGSSDVKHFFSSAHSDSQHLNPGEQDSYGSNLNATQSLYSPGSEVDPVTGELHRPDYLGAPNADGVNISNPQPPTSSIDRLLQVAVADLDPAQNPAGTHWYLMGNLFIAGDQDVTNNSRWEEVVPHFSGSRFTFTESGGGLNFRNIPGLVDPGLTVTGYSPTSAGAPVSQIQISFDRAVDPTTFTPDSITSFTGPGGDIPVLAVTPVDGRNDSFYVTFPAQGPTGVYSLVLGTGILDTSGNPLPQPYTAQFTIVGPAVVSTLLTGTLNGQVDHDRLVFSAPVDPNSFTPDQYALQDPNGNLVNVTSITPVDSTDTQFDITFDAQTTVGSYTLTVGPNITDLFGNPMDAPFSSQFLLINQGPNLVVNGGFETGNFSGWALSGNTGSTTVGGTPHSGSYAANLGPVGSEGFITQTLLTTPGTSYVLTYWLANGGGTPNQFEAYIDGSVVPGSQLINAPGFSYTQYSFTFVAAGPTTQLRFGFQQDPSYYFLDDVSVSALNGPRPSGGPGGHAAFGGAVLPPAHAPAGQVGGTGVWQVGQGAPAPGGVDGQAAWEAARAGLVDRVLAGLSAQAGVDDFLPRPLGSRAPVDPLGGDDLGDGPWWR